MHADECNICCSDGYHCEQWMDHDENARRNVGGTCWERVLAPFSCKIHFPISSSPFIRCHLSRQAPSSFSFHSVHTTQTHHQFSKNVKWIDPFHFRSQSPISSTPPYSCQMGGDWRNEVAATSRSPLSTQRYGRSIWRFNRPQFCRHFCLLAIYYSLICKTTHITKNLLLCPSLPASEWQAWRHSAVLKVSPWYSEMINGHALMLPIAGGKGWRCYPQVYEYTFVNATKKILEE